MKLAQPFHPGCKPPARLATPRCAAFWTLAAATLLHTAAAQALASGPVPAAPVATETRVPQATIAQALQLASDAAQIAAPPRARVTAEAGRLDPRLTLAPCTRIDTYLPAGMPAWGALRVGLRCTEGSVRWHVFLPVQVQVVAPAVVVTVQLPAGARLEESHLRRVEVDWSAAGAPLFEAGDGLVGRLLARALQPGQPLQASHLQARQWFAQGDTVRIIAAGPGYSIVSEGQALTAGQEGRPARVQTENGRVLTGRPVSDRCVEVAL